MWKKKECNFGSNYMEYFKQIVGGGNMPVNLANTQEA